jgi:hypothetical protein
MMANATSSKFVIIGLAESGDLEDDSVDLGLKGSLSESVLRKMSGEAFSAFLCLHSGLTAFPR